MPELELYLHDAHVGTVRPAGRDATKVSLEVDRAYRPAVLLSEAFAALPGRRPETSAVSNFLGGYVPEGNQRTRMATKRRINPDDLFQLLREFGGSVAGAAVLRRADETDRTAGSYEPLTDRDLATRLRRALDDADQGIPDDSRSTLPGYQPKVLAARFDGQWSAPHGRAHSTHILKPQVPARPTRIVDEHYSHLIAGRIGLSAYDSRLLTAGPVRYLAIERFDRVVENDTVRLHHQEDLAQALDLDWRNTDVKFQNRDWAADPRHATARRIGELLGSIPGGEAAVELWVRHLTFHIAIGNNDAHAKNVAILHLPTGAQLAPVYDAVPNLFQQGLVDWSLALAIDGEFDQRRMSVERLVTEADSWGVMPASSVADAVMSTLTSLRDALAAIDPPSGSSPAMTERLQWTVDRLLAGAEISEPKR